MTRDIIVLDLETARSARDVEGGWENKAGLGLSIGGYYSFHSQRIHWFDMANVTELVRMVIVREPLLVSFNGIGFDFALMRAVIRHVLIPDMSTDKQKAQEHVLQTFKAYVASSYDILVEIWRADPEGKRTKGLNSLDAICAANGLGQKLGNGEMAPIWWNEGRRAKVLAYLAQDIALTVELFKLIGENKGLIQRRNGPLQLLRYPDEYGQIVEIYPEAEEGEIVETGNAPGGTQ